MFREVAGEHATYINLKAEKLDAEIFLQQWIADCKKGKTISSGALNWLSWSQSAKHLLRKLTNNGGI